MTKGPFRLWAVLSVIWLIFWGPKVREAYEALHTVQGLVGKFMPHKRAGFVDKMLGGLGDFSLQLANENLRGTISYLIGGPIILALLCGGLGWVISGFRADRNEGDEYLGMRRKEPSISNPPDMRS